ncbi:MAG: hypothetical protein Kow00121_12840 [Elainellaceae cyanobacterium]
MSTPKMIRAVQNLFKQIHRMARTLTKAIVGWLLRGLLVTGRKPLASKAGFVLPTTVLLLLVVTLTVGAIGYRTYTRSQQVIGERQQRVIYNAATPAIDRAKSKLEFMFTSGRDRRYGGVPSEGQLLGMMLNDGTNGVPRYPADGPDPYTFPDEQRMDLNGDGKLDNAWYYKLDRDGDGTDDSRVVYSVVFGTPPANATDANLSIRNSTRDAFIARAAQLMVRNAPLSNASQTNTACLRDDNSGQSTFVPIVSEQGWFEDPTDTTRLRKNFQVDAFVLPIRPDGTVDANSTVATLEFQQDRQATQGFKWAAWFRNDIEVFPGPQFNWNGAMHTEGSYFVSGNFRAYMVSSPFSCLYREDASRFTTPDIRDSSDTSVPNFQGQFVTGTIRDNDFDGSPKIDIWDGEGRPPITDNRITMTSARDSLRTAGNDGPVDIALDPVKLQTEDVSVGRSIADPRTKREDPAWTNGNFSKRLQNLGLTTPYLDDTFRADNRYGPKPRFGYNRELIPGDIGDPISAGNAELTGLDDPIGLDGYWERRARKEGMRIIVGQRLELGDPAGWGGPTGSNRQNREAVANLVNEPLRPWSGDCTGNDCHEARQRRNQWDNLAAVQTTAVYHTATSNVDFPAACLVSTVHPGTAGTLDKSATFENLAFGFENAFAAPYDNAGTVISDFFRGRGTNGWEYQIPYTVNDLRNLNSPIMKGIRNLAYFAGDPKGGAPSFTPVQETGRSNAPHPYPSMAMWGDYSMLRRVIGLMEAGTPYADLSPADKSTLHTAACTIGTLAYNVDYLNKFDLDSLDNPGTLGQPALQRLIGWKNIPTGNADYWDGLRGHIRAIDALIYDTGNGNQDKGDAPYTVPDSLLASIPTAQLDRIRQITPDTMHTMAWMSDSDYSKRSNDPETYVRLLEYWRDSITNDSDPLKEQLSKEINLARLIITKEQVNRDRKWGFVGSYTAGGGAVPEYLQKFSDQCFTWYNSALPADQTEQFKGAAFKEPLMRLCSDRPRYPILFSLFPLQQHGDVSDATQINGERVRFMVRDREDSDGLNALYLQANNDAVNYRRLTDAEINQIAARPLRLQGTSMGFDGSGAGGQTWKLPKRLYFRAPGGTNGTGTGTEEESGTGANGKTPNSNEFSLVKVCEASGDWRLVACSRATDRSNNLPQVGSLYRVSFKDGAFMNGRELLSVRTLDIDLDLLRRTRVGTDFWLPKTGIVYAFREDAVSEANLVRPATDTWANCGTETALRSRASCQMRAAGSAWESKDPPISPRGITPKPVDYFPDPDRRPFGFRLRQGAALWRGTGGSTITDAADPPGRGLSFITDNPAYIQGPFNLHRSPGEASFARNQGLEEFTERLNTTSFDNFYTRDTLNEDFARPSTDQWRPAEILADAVTPLSSNFCDGSLEDGLITTSTSLPNPSGITNYARDRYGCTQTPLQNLSSYMNQNRPSANMVDSASGNYLVRANLVDSMWPASGVSGAPSGRGESPLFFYRTGEPMRTNNSLTVFKYTGSYTAMDQNKPLINAANGEQMNMIMVSGLVPSREGQSYGGLHNFPRFIESWNDDELFMSGAFLQLNFSTYATAPFDQQQWQPSQPDPTRGDGSNEWISYYRPPDRRWGFDVALKYAPPGPVAERFKSPDPNRSEFYNEPAADDPYIQRLSSCANAPNTCRATP